jgi:hypothetical protein
MIPEEHPPSFNFFELVSSNSLPVEFDQLLPVISW